MRLGSRLRASDSGRMRARWARREIRQSRSKVQSRSRLRFEGACRPMESKFYQRGDASRLVRTRPAHADTESKQTLPLRREEILTRVDGLAPASRRGLRRARARDLRSARE